MNYVGIDWAYGRAAWCAMGETGTIAGEGMIPAEESGLARLVLELGTEVEACVEMMSGAVWVRDQLRGAGWQVKVAHARKVRDVAPLACKTDRVDARVLAELCRRDLVPELWVPSLEDRALRERLRRRMHLVKTRTAARNRIFGLLTQFGLRVSYRRLRRPDAMELPGAPRGAGGLAGLDRRADRAGRGDGPPDHAARPRARSAGASGRAGEAAGDDARASGRCSASPSPPRSARSLGFDPRASWSATPAWRRG